MLQCSLLDIGILYFPPTTSRFVGHGDDDSHFIAGGKDGFELRGRKFWGAEIGDSDVLFHIVKKNPDPKARIRFVNHECRCLLHLLLEVGNVLADLEGFAALGVVLLQGLVGLQSLGVVAHDFVGHAQLDQVGR